MQSPPATTRTRTASNDPNRTSFLDLDAPDEQSDYGPDFTDEEERLLIDLLARIPGPAAQSGAPAAIGSTVTPPPQEHHNDDDKFRSAPDLHPAMGRAIQMQAPAELEADGRWIEVEIERDPRDSTIARREESVEEEKTTTEQASRELSASPTPEDDPADTRSPLERFRTPPKKPLSVTDLISPAWCELQYWYTLTKHGRKRRTPAMKQGSVVHQVLQDQVHRTVPVETATREDSWGLRIWNVIQGLKTLRETGMTREFEVWGVVDGAVVNGVIDELSYECPDRVLDAEIQAESAAKLAEAGGIQRTLDDYIRAAETNRELGATQSRHGLARPDQKIYITDVKTRVSGRALPKSSGLRPTLMQLLIYHRLLSDLASDRVDADVIFNRYRLDASARFTDAFIAQVGSLESTYRVDELDASVPSSSSTSQPTTQSSQETGDDDGSLDILLEHNSLRQLWDLMREHLRETFPAGRHSVGDVLKVEYRRQTDGEVVGVRTLVHDEALLNLYLAEAMRWWKGERAAVGVPVEEAFKCRICEFAETCSWRNAKVEENIQKQRASRTRSIV